MERFSVPFAMKPFLDIPAVVRSVAAVLRRRAALVIAACLGGMWAVGGVAAPPVAEDVTPELYYMENDAGQLVPVPGFRYRDFMDLLRMREGLGGPMQPPGVIVEKVGVRIDAREAAASDEGGAGDGTCPVTVEFGVRQARAGWTLVPLAMNGVLLTEPPRHDGPGTMLVDVDPKTGGYRAWLDLPPTTEDARHTITLEGRIAVDATAAAEAFTLHVPPSVASRVEVRSARPVASLVIHADAAARTIVPEPDGVGSIAVIAGLAGVSRIRLGDAAVDQPPRAGVAQVTTETTVRIDGRNAVFDAIVKVANVVPGPARFRVALPVQTTLREVVAPAMLVATHDTNGRTVLDLAIDASTDGTASFGLVCERPIDSAEGKPFEAIGFAVDGIPEWRQWGRVSLVVEGDWRVAWGDAARLRRVDPAPSIRQEGFVAAFAYDAQPASLPVEVRPRRSRVVIEPEYRYDVGASRVRLEARLRVAVRGAPVGSIAMAIDPEWVIDEVGPSGAVDAAACTAESGEVVIPFIQPLAGDTVIELRASRLIAKDVPRVAWKLPSPKADLVGPAAVVVASPSDIELLPDTDGISGLVRQTAAAMPLANADRTSLVYRLDAPEGAFAAARRFLPRRVEATVTAQASLDATEIVVEQLIRLNVLHVPLEVVELLVPETVVAAGTFSVRQEDDLLDPIEVAAVPGQDEGTPLTYRAVLPSPLLGNGEISVRFRLPMPDVPAQSTVAIEIPFVLPIAASVGREHVSVAAPDALVLGVRGDTWRRDVAPAGGAAQAWTAVKPQAAMPLTVSTRGGEATRGVVVEAAWLQTRMLPGVREDTRSYVVVAPSDRIALSMPGETPLTRDVRLDGEIVPVEPRGGRLVIELPRNSSGRRWRLDIRTTTARDRGWAAVAGWLGLPFAVTLEPPVFEPPVIERRFYWTVHVRSDEHALGLPRAWTSQQRWVPASFGWKQSPAATSADLSMWLAAMAVGDAGGHESPHLAVVPATVPPLEEQSFVYSGVGAPGTAHAWVVPTWSIVLMASGASLAAGLLAVYRAAWRRVSVLVSVIAILGLGAAAFPEIAPLVAQAAVPGAALALLAWALRFTLERRPRRDDSFPAPASSLTRPAVQPSLIVAQGIDQPSTATHARLP